MGIFDIFINSEILGTPRTIFKRYQPGYFHVVCNANIPVNLLIVSSVLKPDKVEGLFKGEIWGFFLYF